MIKQSTIKLEAVTHKKRINGLLETRNIGMNKDYVRCVDNQVGI